VITRTEDIPLIAFASNYCKHDGNTTQNLLCFAIRLCPLFPYILARGEGKASVFLYEFYCVSADDIWTCQV